MFKNSLIAILVSVFIITIALIPSQLPEAQAAQSTPPTLTIGAPTGNTVNVGTDSMKITVTWTDSTTGATWKVTEVGGTSQTVTSRTVTFQPLEKDVKHCFTVQRTLPASTATTASIPKCSPVQSVIFPALLQTGLQTVQISWTQTDATDPAATPSGYKVERVLRTVPTTQVCSTGTSPSGPCSSSFIQLTPSPSTSKTYTNTGLVAGSEYCYEIQASWPSPRSYPMDSDKMCIKLDTTPPVITYAIVPATPVANVNGWYNTSPQVVWTVTESESTILSKTGCVDTTFNSDTSPLGTTLTCSATSGGGTSATTSVTIKRDATKPVITLNDVSPLYLQVGGTYTEFGAIASDATSGPDGTVVVSGDTVDTSTPGVYIIKYNVNDKAGNAADEVTRTVDVVDINLDAINAKYNVFDNVYVTVTDFLAYDTDTSVLVDLSSLSPPPAGAVIETLTGLSLQKDTGVPGKFSNTSPATVVLNDDCLTEDPPSCEEPLLTVVTDGDVFAKYKSFESSKAIISSAAAASGQPGAPPRTTDTIRFLESDRYVVGGAATVKVNDATKSGSVSVKITSTQDSTGFTITLNEDTPTPSAKFTSTSSVTFTSGASANPAIKAGVGDTVTATYLSGTATPATLTVVASDSVAFAGGNIVDPTRRDSCANDIDGDGLCDTWETSSGLRIPTSVSGVDYFIPCTSGVTYATDPSGMTVCPTTDQKDVYLEIDYMTGHAPSTLALDDVTTALKAAPIRGLVDGAVNGINLHRQLDEQIGHQKDLPYSAGAGVTSFNSIKLDKFGTSAERTAAGANVNAILTAKRQVFHYTLFAHQQTGDPNSSGVGEKPGNDILITLGAFTGKQGTRGQNAATLLHELGHNFGLGHGGIDEVNCKANYISVMNYLFQFDGTEGGFINGRLLSYSSYKFSNITENALREDVPSITSQSKATVIGGPFTPKFQNTNTRVDWNRAGGLSAATTTYAQDTNFFSTVPDCSSTAKTDLVSYNDNANLVYNFRGQGTFDSGAVVIGQFHTSTSTIGIVTNEEFFTEISNIPDQSGDEGVEGFSGSGVYGDPDADGIVGTIDWGDGTILDSLTITPVTDVGANFSFGPHTYGDNNAYTATVKITATRNDGTNDYSYDSTNTATFTVNNVAPAISSVTGPAVNEGGSTLITVVATDVPDDTISYSFDCANDGIFEIGPQSLNTASCPAPDNPSITVAVKADDEDGGSTPSSIIVPVLNVAPVITLVGNNGPVNAGSSATITVAATDVPDDTISYSFDCDNNGIFDIGPQTSNSALCLAPSAPSLTVVVQASDEDGGVSPTSTTTVTVVSSLILGNFISPIDNTNYNDDRTLPVKITVTNSGGQIVTNANLFVFLDNNVANCKNSTGGKMTFNAAGQFYECSLKFPNGIADGLHTIKVKLAGGNPPERSVTIRVT